MELQQSTPENRDSTKGTRLLVKVHLIIVARICAIATISYACVVVTALYLQKQCHSCQGPFGWLLFGFQVKCPHVGRPSLFGLVDGTLVDVARLLLVHRDGLDEDDRHARGEFFQTGVDDHASLQDMTHRKLPAVKSFSCDISGCYVRANCSGENCRVI